MIRGGTRPILVALALALTGCATIGSPARKLPDGTYEVACTQTLATCLQAFETLCAWHGYDVISAAEHRHRSDLRDPQDDTTSSEAHVRCKSGEPLFGRSPAAPPTSPATPTPSAAAEPGAGVTATTGVSTLDGGSK